MTWREKLQSLVKATRSIVSPGHPDPESEPEVLAIALAGGGARASFQFGALRYLYDHAGIQPNIFTGTSAGAILAAALAQHSDPEDQRLALARVEEIWSGMNSSADMFEEMPWFGKFRTHLPTWMKVVTVRQDSQRRTLIQSIQAAFSDMFTKREDGEVAAATESKAPNPLEALTTLWEGALATTDLQQIMRGFSSEPSAFLPGPVVTQLLDPHVFDPQRLSKSSVQLRMSVVGLESGQLRYVTERGELRDVDDAPFKGEPVDLVDAVTASCSIPGVFAPVALAGEHYVDGGIRANLPTDIAYTLGANRVIAIVSTPAGPASTDTFEEGDLLEVVMRTTTEIMPDELQQLQIRLARAQGALIIDPVIDVHDALTVDPGLIRIADDYGWMRAHDIMTAAGAQVSQLTHDIIDLRRHLWALEDRLFAPDSEVDTQPADSAPEQLGELKLHLRNLLKRAPEGHLPPQADAWWREWERHPFSINEAPSWVETADVSS